MAETSMSGLISSPTKHQTLSTLLMAQLVSSTVGLEMEILAMKMRLPTSKASWLVTDWMSKCTDSKVEPCGQSIFALTKQELYFQMSGWFSEHTSMLHPTQLRQLQSSQGPNNKGMERVLGHTIMQQALPWYSQPQKFLPTLMHGERWCSAYGLLKKKDCGDQVRLQETFQQALR